MCLKMAKKKNSRQKHQKEVGDPNTSDDEGNCTNNKGCPHASRAINLSKIKKYLKTNPDIEKCVGCLKNPSNDATEEDALDCEVWLCLQCGHCGCGRSSPSQHAIAHHKTPRSDSHTIVLNTTSMSVWCYECDDEIQHRTSRIIRECVDLVKKAGAGKKLTVYMNGSVPEVSKSNATNDSMMMKKVVDTEPAASAPSTKNVSEESAKIQPPKNTRKADQNTCKGSIKGLRNLGHTCFFNAVMQNLSQTPWLLNEFEKRSEKGYDWEIPFPVNGDKDLNAVDDGVKPLKVSLGDCFPLVQSLQSLLKQMNSDSQSKKSEVLNPGTLFEQICKKSPQFRGFQQQDSHELLRHLLDGVRNEEIRRQKRGILKALNLEKVDRNTADEETKQTVKAYGIYASHTIVEKIFGGQLLSTVVCEECKVSSQVFEPFMDLSLPLAEEKPMRANKCHKHDMTEDYGMQRIGKGKESDNKLSKHQERKMRQQAKKTAKRQAKLSKTKNISPVLNEETAGSDAEDGEFPDAEQKVESNNELSDADIEDNEDSESVSCKRPESVSEKEVKVNGSGSDEGICEEPTNCAQEMDDRLQELCSQITDIRIRRDSDRQENFLENLDSPTGSGSKSEENGAHHNASDLENNHMEAESWVHSQPDQLKKEWLLKSLTTVKPRYQPSAHECSVNSCLNQFTAPELLTGSNKFRCENCTTLRQNVTGNKSEVVYSNASKQLLIFSPPAVLTLHLKRFQQTGMSLRKLNLFVEFPRVLDLAPYCSSVCVKLPHLAGVKDEILYSLYGIVQHSGRLTSGHYTAFVRLNKSHLNPAFLNNWPMGQCSLDQLLDKIRKVKPIINENVDDAANECKNVWYYVSDGHFNEVSEAEVFKCQAYILFYERIK